jgi:5'-3' exonuclease
VIQLHIKENEVNDQHVINIAIDADSLIFKACYRHQIESGVNIELAYMEFCHEIGKIRSAVFRLLDYKKGDFVRPLIVLSPKKTFRNDLSEEYKANRPPLSIYGIKQLKIMVMHRFGNWAKVVKNVEADDVVIYYARNFRYLVSAIDKDVIKACPTACFDYNKNRWESPRMPYEIEQWYAYQALVGDTADNIKGAAGVGEVTAHKWIEKYFGDSFSWSSFVNLFGDDFLAIQAMNLVRMDRLKSLGGELVHSPWEPFQDDYWDF